MKAKSYFLLISIFFISSSCHFILKRQYLAHKWNFTDQNMVIQEGDEYAIPVMMNTKNSCLRLFNDDTFTFFTNGKYTYGKWEYDENVVFLTTHDNSKLECKVKEFEPTTMTLDFMNFEKINKKPNGTNEKYRLKFVREDYEIDEEFDPFRPETNEWQTKSKKKENWQELNKKAKNHLRFLIGFHKISLKKKVGVVSFNEIVTPFQFLKNGIFVNKEESKDEFFSRWKSTFYDDEDAFKCRKLLKKAMYKTKIKSEIKDTILFNLDILEQMLSNLDQATSEMK